MICLPTERELRNYADQLSDFVRHKLTNRIRWAEEKFKELIKQTKLARFKAKTYKTAVYAGIQTTDGEIFTSGNIENTSRFFDRHAELVASERAMMADGRKYQGKDFVALAVNTTKYAQYAVPMCAGCRQWLWENSHPDLEIITFNSGGVVLAIPLKLTYPLPWPRKIRKRKGE